MLFQNHTDKEILIMASYSEEKAYILSQESAENINGKIT